MKNAILHLNYGMVLVATIAYFVLGALWYSKILFGRYWAKSNNIDINDRSGFATSMIIGFLSTFLIVTTTGLLLNAIRCRESIDCLLRSYVLVSGIVVGVLGITLIFQKKPIGLIIIEVVYHLLGVLIACLILSKWGMSTTM